MVSYLQADHITYAVGDKTLFTDLTFGIGEGQRVGLIAQNGTGKTSLLNILARRETPDTGTVTLRSGLRVAYLEQTPVFPAGMSVIEACLWRHEHYGGADIGDFVNAHSSDNIGRRTEEFLSRLGITDIHQPVEQLSGGQVKRVALASVMLQEADMLILDEPTNHLDLPMTEWLEGFLARPSMTLLMVTHDRYFLDRVCTQILELADQTVYSYRGNYAYFLEKRQERLDARAADVARATNIYRRELEWMRRQPQARGHKARYREEAFEDLQQRTRQNVEHAAMTLRVNSPYIGSKIFEAEYVSKAFGDNVIMRDFYYNFSRYEKLGIVGANGTGKSTFVRLLLGLERPDQGRFVIGETVRFGYFSQEGLQYIGSSDVSSFNSAASVPPSPSAPSASLSAFSSPSAPSASLSALSSPSAPASTGLRMSSYYDDQTRVIDVARRVAEYVDLGGGRHLTAMQFLQHFLFTPEQQQNYVYKLSGGERRRLHLCTVLMQMPNFLILDEPTNDLDIATLSILEDYLRDFRGCVIVVSHDRYFTDKVVDHLLVFHGQGRIQDFPGNYTQFRQWEKEQARATADKANKSNKAKANKGDKVTTPHPLSEGQGGGSSSPRRLSFKERREMEALETDIASLEAEKQALETALCSGTLSVADLTEKSRRLPQLTAELDEKELRWLELSEIGK